MPGDEGGDHPKWESANPREQSKKEKEAPHVGFHRRAFLITEDLDMSAAVSTGGQTGSVRARLKKDGSFVQFKPDIKSNKATRQVKANWTDRENFGEYIACILGRAMFGNDALPEVSLIYDAENGTVAIGSHYLSNVKGSLNDYMRELGLIFKDEKKVKHVRIVAERVRKPGKDVPLEHPSMEEISYSLARSLARRMVLGDHDVNPSNIMIVMINGKPEAINIDLGHAFSDLINAPEMVGGGVRNDGNFIIDFFNRTNVAGLDVSIKERNIGSTSKLWRDYPGLMPSKAMAQALREVANSNMIRQGQVSPEAFVQILEDMERRGNQAGIDHIYRSLIAINRNINAIEITGDMLRSMSHQDACAFLFNSYISFCNERLVEMQEAANLMELQAEIDDVLKNDLAYPMDKKSAEYKKLQRRFTEVSGGHKKIIWIKTYEDTDKQSYQSTKPVVGGLDDYLKVRQIQLQRKLKVKPKKRPKANQAKTKDEERKASAQMGIDAILRQRDDLQKTAASVSVTSSADPQRKNDGVQPSSSRISSPRHRVLPVLPQSSLGGTDMAMQRKGLKSTQAGAKPAENVLRLPFPEKMNQGMLLQCSQALNHYFKAASAEHQFNYTTEGWHLRVQKADGSEGVILLKSDRVEITGVDPEVAKIAIVAYLKCQEKQVDVTQAMEAMNANKPLSLPNDIVERELKVESGDEAERKLLGQYALKAGLEVEPTLQDLIKGKQKAAVEEQRGRINDTPTIKGPPIK